MTRAAAGAVGPEGLSRARAVSEVFTHFPIRGVFTEERACVSEPGSVRHAQRHLGAETRQADPGTVSALRARGSRMMEDRSL